MFHLLTKQRAKATEKKKNDISHVFVVSKSNAFPFTLHKICRGESIPRYVNHKWLIHHTTEEL